MRTLIARWLPCAPRASLVLSSSLLGSGAATWRDSFPLPSESLPVPLVHGPHHHELHYFHLSQTSAFAYNPAQASRSSYPKTSAPDITNSFPISFCGYKIKMLSEVNHRSWVVLPLHQRALKNTWRNSVAYDRFFPLHVTVCKQRWRQYNRQQSFNHSFQFIWYIGKHLV